MAEIKIRFPQLCAWCGTRAPSATRQVKVSHTQGRRESKMEFDAPICEECDTYATALQKANRTRTWWAIIGSFVVGMLLPVLACGPKETITWPMGFTLSFVLMAIALVVMGKSKQKKKLDLRMAGEPPEGYASSDWQPCWLLHTKELWFFSETYREFFAALNPGLGRKNL